MTGLARDKEEPVIKPTLDDSPVKPTSPSEPVQRGKRVDRQLRSVLAALCQFHNLAYSDNQVVHGLPIEHGQLALANLDRAAGNLGLRGEMRRKNPVDISALLYPFVAFFRNGDIGIVKGAGSFSRSLTVEVHDGSGKPEEREFSVSALRGATLDGVFIAVPRVKDSDNASDMKAGEGVGNAWFWPVVRRFWPNWSYVIVATLVINLLGLALPLFVLNVYDKVIPNESIPTLWALVGGVGIALGFDFILRLMRAGMIDRSGERVDLAVSADVFSRAVDVRMADRQLNAGQISNQVREFDQVRDFLSSTAIASLIDIVFIGIFLALFWFIVGELALVPIVAVPVVIFATLLIQLPLKRAVNASQAAATNRHSVLVDTMVGIETIKAVSAEGIMQKRWEQAVARSASAGVAMRFWSSFAVYLTMFAQQVVSVVVITWGVFLVLEGAISIGALIACNILVGRILSPLGSTAATLMRLQQSITAYRNINALMRLDRESRLRGNSFKGIASASCEFKDVSFSYPGQAGLALEKVSFTIEPGERVGIIGRVGSGKSTIGKLLCGLYRQNSGQVFLDGADLGEYPIADVRNAVGYVTQESELFSGSLRENILISHPARADRLDVVGQVSGVSTFAAGHPQGLDMNVGERGRALSGGQRQAVGLARMMICDPDLLYLDEPTSQMDQRTEAAFISNFRNWLPKQKTLLLATHRHSLLSLVDRLIVLEAGRLVADGPKAKVLEKLGNGNKPRRAKTRGGRND